MLNTLRIDELRWRCCFHFHYMDYPPPFPILRSSFARASYLYCRRVISSKTFYQHNNKMPTDVRPLRDPILVCFTASTSPLHDVRLLNSIEVLGRIHWFFRNRAWRGKTRTTYVAPLLHRVINFSPRGNSHIGDTRWKKIFFFGWPIWAYWWITGPRSVKFRPDLRDRGKLSLETEMRAFRFTDIISLSSSWWYFGT